jgi:hypothetical protein
LDSAGFLRLPASQIVYREHDTHPAVFFGKMMFEAARHKFRVWRWRRQYRFGHVLTKFIARDIRREVEVVDVSRIEEGVISVKLCTWNVLYAARGITPKPPFGGVRKI